MQYIQYMQYMHSIQYVQYMHYIQYSNGFDPRLIRNLELKCQCSYYYYYSKILAKSSQHPQNQNQTLCRPLNFFPVILLGTDNTTVFKNYLFGIFYKVGGLIGSTETQYKKSDIL